MIHHAAISFSLSLFLFFFGFQGSFIPDAVVLFLMYTLFLHALGSVIVAAYPSIIDKKPIQAVKRVIIFFCIGLLLILFAWPLSSFTNCPDTLAQRMKITCQNDHIIFLSFTEKAFQEKVNTILLPYEDLRQYFGDDTRSAYFHAAGRGLPSYPYYTYTITVTSYGEPYAIVGRQFSINSFAEEILLGALLASIAGVLRMLYHLVRRIRFAI